MYVSETTVRVRYAETDKMGVVYYGNYTHYYEVGRVEALRQLGSTYRLMEEQGIMLPVVDCDLRYLKPAFYDDLLLIKTTVKELPGIRIRFNYQIFNQDSELINEGNTTLVFMDMKTRKPCMAPAAFLKVISAYF